VARVLTSALAPRDQPGELAERLPPGVAIPDLPTAMVERARLVALLDQGVRGTLTLLSAPAGTGKTVLASSWARTLGSGYPVAWLSCSREEGPDSSWPRLPAALRASGVSVPGTVFPGVGASAPQPWLTRLAAAIVAHPVPVVLVLDEGDAGNAAIHPHLATLLGATGDRLRVVLLTRSDPPLPLNAFRLDGQLTEIRAADLSFRADEAARLFELSGVPLTPLQTATLVHRTSGWAVGLRLAALGLRDKLDLDAAVADFSGNQDNVSTYLASEVLQGQTTAVREVLLRTSVVEALSPGLFESLTGLVDGRRVMAFMARSNSFIEAVPDYPGWYRYQSLFREFLRTQLACERPELVEELHHQAADWFARNGFLTRAVQHAASIGAWGDAATYLIDDLSVGALVAELWATGRADRFSDMPEHDQGTASSVVRAALALGAGDQVGCAQALGRARASVGDDPDTSAACVFSIALLETLSAVARADVIAGLSFAYAAEQQLRGSHPEAARTRPELALLLALSRASLNLGAGDVTGAADALTGVAPLSCDSPGSQRLNVVALGLRGLVEAMAGNLDQAVEHAQEADRLVREAGVEVATWSWQVPATRAWVLIGEHDVDGATRQLLLAEASLPPGYDLPGLVLGMARAALVQAQRAAPASTPGVRADVLGVSRGPRKALTLAEISPRPWQFGATPVEESSERRSPGSGTPLVEALTAKELEVLGHLADLLSTTEIAGVMFISVNTVRTHVRNILRKLAVVRRNDAVRRAWDLGLLATREGQPSRA